MKHRTASGTRSRGGGETRVAAGARLRAEPAGEAPFLARGYAVPLLLFVFAFVLRLLFLRATPDAAWPYSACYRGDAVSWLEYARAIHLGLPHELGLPTRPPGMAWLLVLLGGGGAAGPVPLKIVWCGLGAAIVGLLHVACRRSFGPRVALVVGLAAASSTGLLLLSTSLNNETPYLLLAVTSLLLLEPLREEPRATRVTVRLGIWSAVNALACLVRVEHVLFFLAASALLAGSWARARAPGLLQRGVVLALCFVAPLLPWEIAAFRSTARVNAEIRPTTASLPPEIRELEMRLGGLSSDASALEESRRLPGFARRLGTDFVAATVMHRGGTRLSGDDFRILEDAYGYRPEPLSHFSFVTDYGALNFYLANNRHATGGFNRLALDDPPPWKGGRERYYPGRLLEPTAPGMFAIDYPPHLAALNHGYGLGARWIAANPAAFVALTARKLGIFWSGAALGLTGFGFPTGLAGIQRAVDLVVPRGGVAALWRILVLVASAAGFVAARRNPAFVPWVVLLASKVVVTVLYFGYARIGATILPVVFLLVALAAERWVWPTLARRFGAARGADRPPGRSGEGRSKPSAGWSDPKRLVLGLAALLLVVEVIRVAAGPQVRIDGRPIDAGDPFPGPVQVDRVIDVGFD